MKTAKMFKAEEKAVKAQADKVINLSDITCTFLKRIATVMIKVRGYYTYNIEGVKYFVS